jgi:hypothetical protein
VEGGAHCSAGHSKNLVSSIYAAAFSELLSTKFTLAQINSCLPAGCLTENFAENLATFPTQHRPFVPNPFVSALQQKN